MIFSKNSIKDAARLSMARWYNKVEEAGLHSFNVIAATFYEHYDDILNFYNNRASNALAESFNAQIKLFRANLIGVVDKKFFLFRIAKLFAYPHQLTTEPRKSLHIAKGRLTYSKAPRYTKRETHTYSKGVLRNILPRTPLL